MALDQQRNWTISMAENLKKVKRDHNGRVRTGTEKQQMEEHIETPIIIKEWTSAPIYLPDEIIQQVLEYIYYFRTAQPTLAACCLLSKQWYDVGVPLLYRNAYLYGKNFDPFVRAICPSINLHVRKSPLSGLVRVLNLGNLVHQSSRSLTARLLGRTKNNLEVFVAPQSSFAMNCFPALSKCHNLHTLDLSLVSESPPLPELFKTVSHLQHLRTFRLPRSSGMGAHHKPASFLWPPNLEDLSLSGGIDGHFLLGVIAFPATLRALTLEHCPQMRSRAVMHLLRNAVRPLPNLESLTIKHMPQLGSHALDGTLLLLPQIRRLNISVDYITPAIFDETHFNHIKDPLDDPFSTATDLDNDTAQPTLQTSRLRTLELTNSGKPGIEDKITPIDILIALDDGALPALRQVRVAKSLLWHSTATSEDAEALAAVLQEASRRDWENGEGVFEGGKLGGGTSEEKPWEEVAGVWAFDG